MFILRFLRAMKFDVERAVELYKKYNPRRSQIFGNDQGASVPTMNLECWKLEDGDWGWVSPPHPPPCVGNCAHFPLRCCLLCCSPSKASWASTRQGLRRWHWTKWWWVTLRVKAYESYLRSVNVFCFVLIGAHQRTLAPVNRKKLNKI